MFGAGVGLDDAFGVAVAAAEVRVAVPEANVVAVGVHDDGHVAGGAVDVVGVGGGLVAAVFDAAGGLFGFEYGEWCAVVVPEHVVDAQAADGVFAGEVFAFVEAGFGQHWVDDVLARVCFVARGCWQGLWFELLCLLFNVCALLLAQGGEFGFEALVFFVFWRRVRGRGFRVL